MTTEEAIKILNSDSCYECTVGCESPASCKNDKCEVRKAVLLAVEVLEKQIPKKPFLDKYSCYRCSCCRTAVEYEARAKGALMGIWRDRICANCGQAIDWSEVEE